MRVSSGFVVSMIVSLSLGSPVSRLTTLGAQDIPTPPGMRKELIFDPALGINAEEVFVPEKWHFYGTMIQGTACTPLAFPVFRATSPDGLSVMERFPRVDWAWGTGNQVPKSKATCLALEKPMSAQDFARYMAGVLKVQYVADVPVPQAQLDAMKQNLATTQQQMNATYARNHLLAPTYTADQARASVRFTNGSFTIDGLLIVGVNCSLANPKSPPAFADNNCQANVKYEHAPQGQLPAVVALLNNAGGVELAAWSQAVLSAQAKQQQAQMNAIIAQGKAINARASASAAAFAHSQDVRQQMHQDFMASMQRGTDMSMNRTGQAMNARSTATSNWVDYSLDRQTVRDPNTGQVTKVSSANSYTWLDASGKTSYQTNDPNADPNGTLRGTWTRQQVVNGDGTSAP